MDTLLDSFSLTIKVGTQKVKFKIDTHQSTEEMFEKLKKIHPDCQHKKQQTLNKFKHDLQSKIQTHNVKQKLAQTIKYYLNKNFKQEHTATSDNQNQNTMESSLLTTQNVSFKASPIKQKIGEKQQKDSKIQPKPLVKNEVSGKSNPKKSATSLNKRTVCAQKNKSQPKKQNISQDLLKAYQTILQKSTQVDIKMMAKKCLEELGKLPAADRKMQPVVTRKHEVSVLDQKQQTTNQAQSKIEKHNKSPIYVLDIPSQRKELNFPQNYDQKFEMPKSSERSPYPKLFTNNRFNYMPQEQEAKYSTGQLSMSALRNTYSNYRKYNYLHNMV